MVDTLGMCMNLAKLCCTVIANKTENILSPVTIIIIIRTVRTNNLFFKSIKKKFITLTHFEKTCFMLRSETYYSHSNTILSIAEILSALNIKKLYCRAQRVFCNSSKLVKVRAKAYCISYSTFNYKEWSEL